MTGPLPVWLGPLTRPASAMYGMAVAARNRRFDRGEGVERVDRPVISIGNVTTGGTGKTPMVQWTVRELLKQGRRPVIAMRGYKARPGELGDEQAEYRTALPDVPVVADADRVRGLRALLPRHAEVDCVVLDDGFQHRRLHRDLDIVLIDASANTFHDELLPAGNLREPLDALSRADAVVVTHADGVDASIAQEVERWHGRPAIGWCRHVWSSVWLMQGPGGPEKKSAEWLRGRRIVTMLGVGNPKAIIAQVQAAGAQIMADVKARDHERYDVAQLITARGLCDGGDGLLVTRKDWVKIEPLLKKVDRWPAPIIVPQLEMDVFAGADRLAALLRPAVPHGVHEQSAAPPAR